MIPPPGGWAANLSVVVPTFDEAERLPRLLAALDGCRPPPREVIVADGGSSDATVEGARAMGARVIGTTRGRASQQAAGAALAGGHVLWFLHADTIPRPNAPREIETVLDRGAPGGCFLISFPPAERGRHRLLPLIERGINARTLATRTGTGDQGLFVRKDVFQRIGGFPDWPLFEDVALSSALKAVGAPAVCRGPLATSARRWLTHGALRTMGRMWALRFGYMLGVSPERLARGWDGLSGPR